MMTVRHEVSVRAPVERCFDLARSVDLHVDSSTEIGARAAAGRRSGLSDDGDVTTWSARFLGMRFSMTTRIEGFSPPTGFDDRLTRGLLRSFTHRYRFAPTPEGGCKMSDELTVEAPFGPLGWLVEHVYLRWHLTELVCLRLGRIKWVAENTQWRRYLQPPER